MVKITIDDELRSRLRGLNEEVELCDAAGRTIAQVVPVSAYEDFWYTLMAAETGLSKEEVRRRRQQKGGRTLAEIWKSLGRQ
ncbi:MAG TPA: hypothetical protein VMV69_30675 [Pirellulales bacterium]|nr:hypothetical protein [Pirellulales bacterium]